MSHVSVYSEVGPLKRVMLHRPGNELAQVHPSHLAEMLFEDTPYLPDAQAEHDSYANLLRSLGVEVVYQRDLFTQAMTVSEARRDFTREFVATSHIPSVALGEAVTSFYDGLSTDDFVESIYCGIRKDAPTFASNETLGGRTYKDDLFLVNPLPNAYFTRDSSINVADGVILSHMGKEARRREPLLMKYIHRYADLYRDDPTEDLYDMSLPYGIEGGDFLVLSDKAVVIGCSERTQPGSIEVVATSLFERGYGAVYAIEMPRGREAMHLDGMLTMVDVDTFMYNPFMSGNVNVYRLAPAADGTPRCTVTNSDWGKVVAEALGLSSVKLIPCGGGDAITGMWELWNLGSNVLTVRPGVTVGYDRNPVCLDLLDKAGIEVHAFKGAELSRGRGGARCMSMPIWREAI